MLYYLRNYIYYTILYIVIEKFIKMWNNKKIPSKDNVLQYVKLGYGLLKNCTPSYRANPISTNI